MKMKAEQSKPRQHNPNEYLKASAVHYEKFHNFKNNWEERLLGNNLEQYCEC